MTPSQEATMLAPGHTIFLVLLMGTFGVLFFTMRASKNLTSVFPCVLTLVVENGIRIQSISHLIGP
jgi:hypothetical protein